MKKGTIVIAIDGTSASGKSTNSKKVAAALSYVYVDTGAMYRTLAWYCLQNNVDITSAEAIADACKHWKTKLVCASNAAYLTVEGYYPAKEIRTSETSQTVPKIAVVPAVREWMKKKQRQCIKFGNLVMEGRDIGTAIFPETEFKFFLDASLKERSERRVAEGVTEDLAARDKQDRERSTSPLMPAIDAVVINNSGLSPEETTAIILEKIRLIQTKKSND